MQCHVFIRLLCFEISSKKRYFFFYLEVAQAATIICCALCAVQSMPLTKLLLVWAGDDVQWATSGGHIQTTGMSGRGNAFVGNSALEQFLYLDHPLKGLSRIKGVGDETSCKCKGRMLVLHLGFEYPWIFCLCVVVGLIFSPFGMFGFSAGAGRGFGLVWFLIFIL